jgi:hypothetical protein
MPEFKPERFLAELRKHLEMSVALIREPEEYWEKLNATVNRPRDIYYYLIIPLNILLGAIVFLNQIFDGQVSAGLSFVFEVSAGILIVFAAAQFLAWINDRFTGERDRYSVLSTAPYIEVPWIVSAIISAVFAELLPFLAAIMSGLLFIAATAVGIYMLYTYIAYYLKIPLQSRRKFFVLALLGLIVISGVVAQIEADLVRAFIEH